MVKSARAYSAEAAASAAKAGRARLEPGEVHRPVSKERATSLRPERAVSNQRLIGLRRKGARLETKSGVLGGPFTSRPRVMYSIGKARRFEQWHM